MSTSPSPPRNPTGDEIERCFRQSDLLSFGVGLADHLDGSGFNLDPDARWAKVTGLLNLSHDAVTTAKQARCRFALTPEWKSAPPTVWCLDDWVRCEIDWHAGVGGIICYVLDEQWCDLVLQAQRDGGDQAATRYAISLCLRNVRWLLYRHHIAHVTRIRTWPGEWPAWPHGSAGRKEYRCQRKVEDK